MTRSRTFALSLFATLSFVIVASSLPAHGQIANATNDAAADGSEQPHVPATRTIVKFNVPGAGTSSGQGTLPFGILDDGAILGEYIDSNGVYHGFLRSPAGTITTFDAPGAGTGSGQGTFPFGINSALTIVGYYPDASGVNHGFLRSSSGIFTTLDDPGAGTGSGQGTVTVDINTSGQIAGNYTDSNGVLHGLVRSPSGTYTTFDAPGAGTGSGQGTGTAGETGLTDTGAIAGNYIDAGGVYHAFLRSPGGTFSTFDPLGSVKTYVIGLSSKAAVAGFYFDSTGLFHGFLRTLNGTITSYDAPNAASTSANNISPGGQSRATIMIRTLQPTVMCDPPTGRSLNSASRARESAAGRAQSPPMLTRPDRSPATI